MLVFDAAAFYDTLSSLQFRGIDDSLAVEHLEGSESCLIHADNTLSRSKGVWINPDVRVAYNTTPYDVMSATDGVAWPSSVEVATGVWLNRLKRWSRAFFLVDHGVENKIAAWRQQDTGHREPGNYCIIDEMQIVLWNGWGHA